MVYIVVLNVLALSTSALDHDSQVDPNQIMNETLWLALRIDSSLKLIELRFSMFAYIVQVYYLEQKI
jgi:hypothetical protein